MRTAIVQTLLPLLAIIIVGCPESLPGSGDDESAGSDVIDEPGADWKAEPDLVPISEVTGSEAVAQPAAQLAECEPESLWFRQPNHYNFIYGDSELVLSPNAQIVVLQSGMAREYFRVWDGEPLGREQEALGSMPGAQWDYDVKMGQEQLTVVHLPSGQEGPVLVPPGAANPALGWLSSLHGVVSPDGSKVAAFACWQVVGPGDTETAVTVWDRVTGQVLRTTVLDDECDGNYWLDQPRLVFAAGNLLLAHVPGSGRLHAVEISGSEVNSVDLVGDLQPAEAASGEPPVYVPFLSPIADFAMAEDDERIAAILHDGNLRFYDLPTMKQFGPVISAGFSGINLMTYGPTTAAPVVWSADASVVAHMSSGGEVAISRVDNGQTVHLLPNPAAESAGAIEGFINPPVAFRFIDNDAGLLVVHEMGMQLWHCDMPDWPELAEVSLTLDGPQAVTAGTPAKFYFDYAELPGPVIHSLVNAEGESYAASLSPVIETHVYGPDKATLRGRIDTGTAQGESAPLEVVVEPSEW